MITDLSAAGSMPSTRLAWRYLNRNSFRTFLLKCRVTVIRQRRWVQWSAVTVTPSGTDKIVTITAAELTQPMALLIAQHYAYKLVLVPAKEVGGAVGVEYYGRHRLRRRLRHDEPRRDGLRDSTVQDHKLGSVKSDTVLYDILTLIRNGNSVTVRFCHNTKTFYFKCFLISTHVIVKCKKKI